MHLQLTPDPRERLDHPDLSWDPLKENEHSPVPGLVHRYPRIALLLVTKQCFSYCRFCFRAGYLRDAEVDGSSILDVWDPVAAYLAEHPEIQEILLSGGDPLTLSDGQLGRLLRNIRAVKPDLRIRIGTRAPVFQPSRITDALIDVLREHHPVVAYVHVNHPEEVTTEFRGAVRRLQAQGIWCYSQSVLLRGINDSEPVLTQLLMDLYLLGVHPAYLHLCDVAMGTKHFMVPVKQATSLWRGLWGKIPGAAIPHLVFDGAHATGKTPVTDKVTVTYDDSSMNEGRGGEVPRIDGVAYPL
jgi:lysine 2,3-aminomutase